MFTGVPLCFVIFFLSTLLTNSMILSSENRLLSVTPTDSKPPLNSQVTTPKASESLPNINQDPLKEIMGMISKMNQQMSTNNTGLQRLKSLKSLVNHFNLEHIDRSQKIIPSNYEDEGDIIYTNDLHLFSALGIESGTKAMEYVKSKVEGNRKAIFQHNFSKKKPYMLTQNKFIIYTPQEFREIYLNLKEPENKNSTQKQPISVIAPTKTNIRNLQETTLNINWKTAKKVTSVKFQQSCGACYSFTAIGAIESAYLMKNVNLNLAEQELIDCSTPYDNYGCIGGWTVNSYRYIKDFGVVYESDYPFVADFKSCSVPSGKQKYFIKDYVELANDCKVVIQALKKQPLSIAINAEGWMYYSSGVYTDCKAGPSNHGVVLAGVDTNNQLAHQELLGVYLGRKWIHEAQQNCSQ